MRHAWLLLWALATLLPRVIAWAGDGVAYTFLAGVDANYSRELADHGTVWRIGKEPADLLVLLKNNGANGFRVRVWTNDGGPSGRVYATALALDAQRAGLKPYLVLFLSEGWSDYVKQPVPPAWQKLPLAEKLARIAQYSQDTAQHFRAAGVQAELYEIGNEIDFGICGQFEESWDRRLNISYMRQHVWPGAADIIRAAQQGIRRTDPQARFILHLTQWWNSEFCLAFLSAMAEQQIQVDYLGLSFFPTSGLSPNNAFADLDRTIQRINHEAHKPVLICEYAYPSLPRFGGQFASWNKPVAGYTLDEPGQQRWIADFLAFCRGNPGIAGAFYWSPEWYGQEMWKAFALFRPDGTAKPGLAALKPVALKSLSE